MFVVRVNDKIIKKKKKITRIVVANRMVNPNHEQTSPHLLGNFQ